MNEELIAAKVAAGLTREQAIEVISRQEAEDAAAEKKGPKGKKNNDPPAKDPPAKDPPAKDPPAKDPPAKDPPAE